MLASSDVSRCALLVLASRVMSGVLGGVQWGPAVDGDKVYVALSDLSFRTLRDSSGNVSTGASPEMGGGLVALQLRDGTTSWRARNRI